MNIQHSTRTDQWGTPPDIIARVKEVFDGIIDLDPASSYIWNETVGATRYLISGLDVPWSGSVYVNPPGGKVGNKSYAGLFWKKLMSEVDSGRITHAVFMAFSAEALQNTQKPGQRAMMDYTFCVPSKRIHFVSPGVEKHAPSHSNVIVYVPGTVNCEASFRAAFETLGCVK